MKKLLLDYSKKIGHKHYFDIEEGEDKLIFQLKNGIPFFKKYLIFKHRKSGKRISKELKSSKAEISLNEMNEMNELGVYDIYLKINVLNKYFFIKRTKFTLKNGNLLISDKNNYRTIESLQTRDYNLSFRYTNSYFVAKAIDLKKENNSLLLNGEIELFKDLNFDSVEIQIPLNNSRKYIPCEYEVNDKIVKFTANIYFELDEEENINNKYPINIRLKDKDIIIDSNKIKANKLCQFNKIEDKYLEYIENFNEKDNSDICSLCYVNNYSNLSFYIIDKNNIKRLMKNEEVIYNFFYNRDDKKLAFFESFKGKSYSGQPKYIYEKLLELGYDKYLNFVWSYDGNLDIPGNPIITSRDSDNYNRFLKGSKYWVTNISFPILKEDEETIYLQTTHGTPYKHMGSDIQTNNKNIPKGRVLLESGTWNYLLSPNNFSKEVFKRAFEYDGTIINKGYPANDIFYKDMEEEKEKIRTKLNIPKDKKIILYAPTFRDYEAHTKKDSEFTIFLDFKKLFDNLSDEYILIVRLHYLLSKNLKLSKELEDFIIDLSDYDDIADLYLISDILISDYSSAFFDYAHSKKPILFFVPDYEKYSKFRGLYSEVKETLPGPEIYSNDELVESIKNINKISKEYNEKYNIFYDKFCNLGHGTSSDDVVRIVFGDVKNE